MDNVKIYYKQQRALSYSNVDKATFVFLDLPAMREPAEELETEPELGCDSDDRVWTHLYTVSPGMAADQGELLATA